jgi:hypothetical protein
MTGAIALERSLPDGLRPLPPGLPYELFTVVAESKEKGAVLHPGVLLPEGICARAQLLEAGLRANPVRCFVQYWRLHIPHLSQNNFVKAPSVQDHCHLRFRILYEAPPLYACMCQV